MSEQTTEDKRIQELESEYKQLLHDLKAAELRLAALQSQNSVIRGSFGIG